MEFLLVCLVVCLGTLCSAHYQGYPFKHMNEGRYGAGFKFANYKDGGDPYIPPMTVSIDINGKNFAFVPAESDKKMEYDFRHVDGFPVHVGHGQFYFLGNFKGTCETTDQAGFYFTGDSKTYMVCENGRAHRFECPNGTRNKRASYFQYAHTYDQSDLCSEHDELRQPEETQQEEEVEETELKPTPVQERPKETTYE